MRAAIEISMYPLTGDFRPSIQAFIDRLNAYPELRVRTNTLSTQIWGELDRVMAILAHEIERAAGGPQPVFVLKVLPGLAAPEEAAPPTRSTSGVPPAAVPASNISSAAP